MTDDRPINLEKAKRKLEAAHAMVSALCKPRNHPEGREWIMSIPAREGYDPDLVIGEALRVGGRALSELHEMRELLEAAEQIRFKTGIRIDQPCGQDEGTQCWHFDHDGRCDLFNSALDAFAEVKKQENL